MVQNKCRVMHRFEFDAPLMKLIWIEVLVKMAH